MAVPPPQVQLIIEALQRLGTATPSDIRADIASHAPHAPPLESIRARLQEWSSDSSNFGARADLFYSVYGMRGGYWGLRAADQLNPVNSDSVFDDNEPDFDAPEGRLILRTHLRRERSVKLIREFKASLKHYSCAVCTFDFSVKYGELGAGYIEAHHVQPLSDYQPDQRTRIEDLVGLCANCHRVLHRNANLTWQALRSLIAEKK